ncbi:hypothetical protein GDO81_015437 [Engystomops pustulosus]|uniref:Uncharacterized protein n=1 Tax=Engystomops pustulosus TaxID=76066 RepID=A0AAV7ALJ9_ENGPU|nr:hypothetical protein GDO81_015437 [Engystomops pustulosus]
MSLKEFFFEFCCSDHFMITKYQEKTSTASIKPSRKTGLLLMISSWLLTPRYFISRLPRLSQIPQYVVRMNVDNHSTDEQHYSCKTNRRHVIKSIVEIKIIEQCMIM